MVRKRPIKISVFDYPEHLNPFREEEEEERRLAQLALEGRTTRCHLLLGSPMSLDSGASSPLSSGVCTPVNGTLRRRMKKRRAPPPPPVPGAGLQVSEECCTSMPASPAAVVETRQQDDSPAAEGPTGIPGPAGDMDGQLHSLVTESPPQDESVNCQQETPLRHSTPPPASIRLDCHADSRPPEHSPSEAAAVEMNQRLSTDKDTTTEVIAATSTDTEAPQEETTIPSTNTDQTEIDKDVILPDQNIKDEEGIQTPNMTENTAEENVNIIENPTESEDATVNEAEKNTVTENEDVKPMAVPGVVGTEVEPCTDKMEITNDKVAPAVLCEEKLSETALPYIDQDSNVPSIKVDEDPCKLSNGHCNGSAEKLGTSPVPSPRLRRLDKFTPQVSHVEIRISDIAEV